MPIARDARGSTFLHDGVAAQANAFMDVDCHGSIMKTAGAGGKRPADLAIRIVPLQVYTKGLVHSGLHGNFLGRRNPLGSRTRSWFGGHRCALSTVYIVQAPDIACASGRTLWFILLVSLRMLQLAPSRHHAPPAASPQLPPPVHISLGVGPEPLKWLVRLPAHPQLVNLYRGVAVLGDIVLYTKRSCWSGIFFTVRCFD